MENINLKKIRTIALEEHYATSAFLKVLKHTTERRPVSTSGPTVTDRLCDLGDLRIGEMDAAGIDLQVLSLVHPGVQQMDASEAVIIAREQNDYLANAVKNNPARFAGFAALPTSAPDEAVRELDRAVNKLGFKGAAIMGHTRERYLDDDFFWPILEAAAALRVPIYIHPTPPPEKVVEAYYKGNYPPNVAARLSTAAWGWHIETAIHCLRLIASGVFDRYPDLQIIIGHLGETLPFMMSRIDNRLSKESAYLKRSFGDCLRQNFSYTFSGFNFLAPFLTLLLQVGIDRIMFSTDYPYSSMESGRKFLDQLPVSPNDKELIAHGNAERLLRI